HDVTETPAAEDAGDRGGGDDEHGSDPEAGQEEWKAQRKLDARQDLRLRESHPAGGLDRVGVDSLDREVRVREDRRDREHHEGHCVVPETDAEDRDPETDEHHARQRAPQARGAEGEEQTAVPVPEPEPERQGDQKRDSECCKSELRRLSCLLEQEREVARHEAERIGEGARDHQRRRFQGVNARCANARRRSAVSASRMASPPAASSSVLKRSGVPMASKIGAPRPSWIRKAATVAIEMVATIAIRSPERIAGMASGNSTRRNVCGRVNPMPRADSSTSGGTERNPTTMF